MAENKTDVAEAVNGQHILSIDEMLSADDTEYRTIAAWKTKNGKGEEIQGFVRVRSLTAEQVQEWRDTGEGPAKKTLGIRLFVDSLVDKDNKPIGNQTHYAAFKKKSNAIQERILDQILDMNGLRATKKDSDAAKNG